MQFLRSVLPFAQHQLQLEGILAAPEFHATLSPIFFLRICGANSL